MFFYDWPRLSSWKISGLSVQPFTFCQKNAKYFIIFAKKNIFLPKYLRFYTSQKKEWLDLDQNWAKTRHLLFKTWKSSISMDSPIVQCGGSVPTEIIWIISEKWKWNFGNLHLPQLAAGSESERKYLLLLRWKVQKSAMKMWAVSTRKMDNMYMPTSCGFYQGDLGDVGLDLHLSWHAGDHHWNHILPCLVLFYLHHPPFFSCLALIKNFGPSRSKHTTKLTNSILFSWLAWDHWHWEVIFYKCNQCNYKCNFVKNLKTHKNSFKQFYNIQMHPMHYGEVKKRGQK